MNQVFISLLFTLFTLGASAKTLTLYTDRPTARLQPVAEKFTQATGANVVIIELPYKDLLNRLQAEGAGSPADVIFTKDLVFQGELAKLGYYQPMNSSKVAALVSPTMRDSQNLWTAISYRVRTLVYDPSRTDVSDIESYEDLAKAKWAGRLCLRTSNNSYNEALVASFIHNLGYEKTKSMLTDVVANLATEVLKGDTALIEAIANGTCEVGLANHYYLAQLLASKPNFPVAIKFLEQSGRGAHINGSGAGIAKTSLSPELAQQFIELLLSDDVQIALSEAHFEYPAVQHLKASSLIKDWGSFKMDNANWAEIATQVEEARRLVKEVEYK